MTFATVVNVVGVLLQVVGVIIALNGLIRTHDAYAERSVAAIATDKAERVRDQAGAVLRRLLRRQRTIALTGTANLSLGGSLRARAIVGWPSLDPKLKTRPSNRRTGPADPRPQHPDRWTRREGRGCPWEGRERPCGDPEGS